MSVNHSANEHAAPRIPLRGTGATRRSPRWTRSGTYGHAPQKPHGGLAGGGAHSQAQHHVPDPMEFVATGNEFKQMKTDRATSEPFGHF